VVLGSTLSALCEEGAYLPSALSATETAHFHIHEGTPMKIGIIGAGNIGATLARKLAASGHEVKLANSKGPDTIRDLARDLGATAVKEEAVQGVEAIVLSIPFGRYPDLANLFNEVPTDVAVIDTSNYYPFRDGAIAEVDGGKPESVWVSEQIGRPVVKAWNAVLAVTLAERGQPNGASGRIAIPVAGDDLKAKATTMKLVEATGFDALDSGSLSDSWRQQPGTPAYCTELTTNELKPALRSADRSRAPGNRDALLREFMAAGGKLTHDEIVARNRVMTA
jgi:8-hydroxy-5-deazaflavin:NADPH oxidoreductase